MPETRTGRPIKAAVLASAACSALFLVVYSITNALAAGREVLPTLFWEWERSIPVLPFLVVPYMSIDAFFVVAPFACTSKREVGILAKRVCAAILVAGAFFLVWPLKLAFERPDVEGVFGPIFDFLHGFDQPHNLFPSLHIALIFILRWTYHRHVRGVWRLVMHGWFVLVTLSTVFTHQHHVPDVLGGAVLALVIFYVFPTGLIARSDVRVTRAPSKALALRYGAGALAAGALAWLASAWTWTGFWLLVWVAFSLAAVAAGYGGLGPRVFRKYAGYLSLPARVLLAPYLVGLWLSRLWFFRKADSPFVEVAPGLFFGRLPNAWILRQLEERGVRSVLDLCAEHGTRPPAGMEYGFVPVMDLCPPEAAVLEEALQFLDRAMPRGPVYAHCALGYGRSGLVVARWLLRSGRASNLEAAAQAVARARPGGLTADGLLGWLRAFDDRARDRG